MASERVKAMDTLRPELNIPGFLGALGRSEADAHEQAKALLREAVFPTGDLTRPSERAAPFVAEKNGEWDAKDVRLIRLDHATLVGMCCAAVGGKGCFCLGSSLAPGGTCAINDHTRRLDIRPGWFVNAGSAGTPRLGRGKAYIEPSVALDGVFDHELVRASLENADKPFTLSLGQWKYVMQEIHLFEREVEAGNPVWNPASPSESSGGWVDPQADESSEAQKHQEAPGALDELEERMRRRVGGRPGPVDTDLGSAMEGEPLPRAPPMGKDPDGGVAALLARVERLEAQERGRDSEVSSLKAKVGSRDDQVRQLQSRLLRMEDAQTRYQRLIEQTLELMDEVRSDERHEAGVGDRYGRADGWSEAVGSLSERVAHVEDTCYEPRGALNQLRLNLKSLNDKLTMGSASFGNFRFTSPADFVEWYQRHQKGEEVSFGLFLDFTAMLHNLDPGTVTIKDTLGEEKAIRDARYNTRLEARVATSYVTSFPDLFGPTGTGGEFGKTLTGYDMWRNPSTGHGIAHTIESKVQEDVLAISNEIDNRLADGPLKTLAMGMVTKTEQYIYSFLKFVDDFYQEMNAASSLSSQEAWDVTKQAIGEVLTDIRTARNKVKTERETNRIMHVWGAMLGLERVLEYHKRSWRNHPNLAGLQMRFVLKRKTDVDGLEQFKTKHKSLEASLNALKQTLTSVQKELKTKADK